MIEQFHFLRPWWLLALVPLAAAIWLLIQGRYDSGNWRSVIDPRLLPHVLSGASRHARGSIRWVLATVAGLAIVALAGPTWEMRQQAVFDRQASLVVALDLSRSMDAADIKPSRLTRARHKITDILNLRKEGQTALVVYAADAFAVIPLTHDTDTILALLPDLDSELMPAQGSRADRALERALELFENSAIRRGDVLLVSDGLSDLEVAGLEALLDRHPGQRLSVLAIGTPEGGPVPLRNGGFLKDRAGAIVIADMNVDNLRRVARHGGGAYATISGDDSDIDTLSRALESGPGQREARQSDYSADLWRELGPGLVLLLLPFAALAFRRGLIWLLPLYIVVLPPDAQALDWQSLWRNDDQRALQLFQQEQHQAAAQLFADDEWQATAKYRAGDYEGAAQDWEQLDSEASGYNRANALAQQGRYEDALAAYDRLLEENPAHEDARFNRQAIEDWLRQQQQQPPQQGDDQQQQQQDGQQSQQQDGQQQQQQDGQQQQQQDGQQSQQQDGQQQQQQDGQQSQQQDGQQSQQQGSQQPLPGESQAPTDSAQDEREPGDPGRSEDDSRQDQQASAQPQPPDSAQSEANQQRSDEEVAAADHQMSEQAAQQWLRKIPDDPGGLLRRKFIYQYRARGGVDAEAQPW
ncbi:MAG: VWA domain-containing protein [Gammaproteobacteria bacterium]|nr:VWA domain-containing protein [Gammaproteobacteria bacterium]